MQWADSREVENCVCVVLGREHIVLCKFVERHFHCSLLSIFGRMQEGYMKERGVSILKFHEDGLII